MAMADPSKAELSKNRQRSRAAIGKIPVQFRFQGMSCRQGKENKVPMAGLATTTNEMSCRQGKENKVPMADLATTTNEMNCRQGKENKVPLADLTTTTNKRQATHLKKRSGRKPLTASLPVGLTSDLNIDKERSTSEEGKIKSLEEELFAKQEEINQLKDLLNRANLQSANVVTQSVIFVQHAELAATKEIERVKKQFRESLVQLETTKLEKKKLELELQSTMEMAFKGFQEHVNRENSKELRQIEAQLQEALMTKKNTECLLKTCMQLLCDVRSELAKTRKQAKKEKALLLRHIQQERSSQLLRAKEEVEMIRGRFDELQVEFAVNCSVWECILEGVSTWSNENRPIKVPNFESVKYNFSFTRLQEEMLEDFERESSQKMQTFSSRWKLGEMATPVKSMLNFPTPTSRSMRRKRTQRRRSFTPQKKISYFLREAVLQGNLKRLEQEVNEHRAVLEKISSLLKYVSFSSLTAHGKKYLIHKIIKQLQHFIDGFSVSAI